MLQRGASQAPISYLRCSAVRDTGRECQEAMDRSIRRNVMNIDGENLKEPCPAPERLGAYVDGKLTPEERALTESHLAKCNSCRGIIKLVIESENEVPPPAPPK